MLVKFHSLDFISVLLRNKWELGFFLYLKAFFTTCTPVPVLLMHQVIVFNLINIESDSTTCSSSEEEENEQEEIGLELSKDDPPVFTHPLADLKVCEGQPVVLECCISTSPDSLIMWYKNMQILRSGTEYQLSFDGKIAQLKIAEVSTEDAGKYECLARSTSGKASCFCRLAVEGLILLFLYSH